MAELRGSGKESTPAASSGDQGTPAGSGASLQELTPAGISVKSKVHEYGGGAFAVCGDTLVFCNQSDQRVYKQILSGTVVQYLVGS